MSERSKLEAEIFQIQQKFWPMKIKSLEALNNVNREFREEVAKACANADSET